MRMPPTMHVPRGDERRAHPRHPHRRPLHIQPVDRGLVAVESVDVSIGGMRVRSWSRVPLGACDVVLSAEPHDRLAVRGTVVEEMLDASTGETTARIVFDSGVRDLAEQAARTDREILVARRRGLAVLAAGVVAVVAVAALVLAGGDERPADPVTTASRASETDREASLVDAPPTPAPVVATTVAAPAAAVPPTPEPAPTAVAAADPAPSPPPAPASTPTAAPVHSEPADNAVTVILGTSPEDTAVSSSMGPSPGVDELRVQLHVTPEPNGTALPVAVTIENRGAETLRFPDGLQAVISATRDGAVAGTTTLTAADITEIAPGQLVSLEGMLDFGATGEYDVAAQVDVAG